MKLRVRFGELRFPVNIEDNSATILALKKAICNTVSIRDASLIKISLNGQDVIDGDDISSLSYHGLVNGDLIHVLSSAVHTPPALYTQSSNDNSANKVLLAQLVEMGFDEGVAESALVHVNNTSVDAALDFINDSESTQDITSKDCGKPGDNSSNNITMQSSRISSPAVGPSNLTSTSSSSHYEEKEGGKSLKMISMPNPVFCRDGISTELASLYDKAGVTTTHEAMFVIIHALILESGFQSKNTSEDCMPLGWNNKSASKLQYVHNLCPSLVCQVVFTSLGPFVYGHAWSSQDSGSHQAKLLVSEYVRGDVSLSSGARAVYRNLHKVSSLVKDCFVHPLLATIRAHLGLTSPFSLIGLPPEIQLVICSRLNATSVAHLSCCCRGLYFVCNDEKLWKFFCRRDFRIEDTSFASWKEQYRALRRQFLAKRHLADDELFLLPQPYPDIPVFNPFLPLLPRHFPSGIIGGPRDLFPDVINLQPQDGRRNPQNLSDTHSGFRLRPGATSAISKSFPR